MLYSWWFFLHDDLPLYNLREHIQSCCGSIINWGNFWKEFNVAIHHELWLYTTWIAACLLLLNSLRLVGLVYSQKIMCPQHSNSGLPFKTLLLITEAIHACVTGSRVCLCVCECLYIAPCRKNMKLRGNLCVREETDRERKSVYGKFMTFRDFEVALSKLLCYVTYCCGLSCRYR